MSSCNISGPIHASLAKLMSLTVLKLSYNNMSSSVPDSLTNLSNLIILQLRSCGLNGSFPKDIFLIPSLEVLDISDNQDLMGSLPNFQPRGSLRDLNLSQTSFTGKLSNLITLCLLHNNLSVDIYSRYDRDPSPFPALRNIMLASCKLRGIPSFVKSQSALLYLDLADNEIQGTIPYWIWQLEYVVHLNLSKNFLTKFEGSVWNFSSNLLLLDLSSNQLQGPFPFLPTFVIHLDYSNNRFNSVIPADIGNRLPFVRVLSLSNNSFQGQIPESFLNASSLLLLDLSRNNFVGTIPKFFAVLTFRVLNFGGNKLHGFIPDTLPTTCTIQLLDLNDNLLEGSIPRSLAYCQKLQVLNLRRNILTDNFPCFLSNISTLRILDLRLNKLHGSIGCSRTSGDWEMLHIVDVASNNFNGAIPGALLNSWKAMMRDNVNVGPEFGHLFIGTVDNYDPKNFKDLLSHLDKNIAVKVS